MGDYTCRQQLHAASLVYRMLVLSQGSSSSMSVCVYYTNRFSSLCHITRTTVQWSKIKDLRTFILIQSIGLLRTLHVPPLILELQEING